LPLTRCTIIEEAEVTEMPSLSIRTTAKLPTGEVLHNALNDIAHTVATVMGEFRSFCSLLLCLVPLH
jgi:hypothetical protein